jgi:hypothetical protein
MRYLHSTELIVLAKHAEVERQHGEEQGEDDEEEEDLVEDSSSAEIGEVAAGCAYFFMVGVGARVSAEVGEGSPGGDEDVLIPQFMPQAAQLDCKCIKLEVVCEQCEQAQHEKEAVSCQV